MTVADVHRLALAPARSEADRSEAGRSEATGSEADRVRSGRNPGLGPSPRARPHLRNPFSRAAGLRQPRADAHPAGRLPGSTLNPSSQWLGACRVLAVAEQAAAVAEQAAAVAEQAAAVAQACVQVRAASSPDTYPDARSNLAECRRPRAKGPAPTRAPASRSGMWRCAAQAARPAAPRRA